MKNTLAQEIESLCFENRNGQKVPLWPYVVAVTGHRSFAKPGEVEGLPGYEIETIKNAFRKELESLAQLWKEKCNIESGGDNHKEVNAPFILLTGMADGADQLAAEVALDLPTELNVKVVAILPMEKELFRLTIDDKERFDSLLKRVYMTYALPLPNNSSEYRAKIADVDNHSTDCLRDKQYNDLGKFLALHSHVLFAFWDGVDMPNLVGGTSTVLHFKLEGNTDEQSESDLLTYTSVGPVVQILTPRNNPENLKEPVAELENPEDVAVFYWSKHDLWDKDNECYFFPGREQMTEENRCKTSVSNMKDIVDTLERIGELNWYSINCPEDVKKELPKSKEYLFKKQNSTEDYCDAETKALIDHYTYVDTLAGWFQSQMKSNVKSFLWGVGWFLFLGSLLSSFWEIRQNGWPPMFYGIFTYFEQNPSFKTWYTWILFTILTLFYCCAIIRFINVYRLSNREKYRIRFYRFRAVAEALRVQIFWRIAEMSNCVSGHYRTHQLHETEWLRTAINGLDVLLDSPKKENFDKTRKERLTFVRDVWINGQLQYFQNKLIEGENAHSLDQLKFVGHFFRLLKRVERFLEEFIIEKPFLLFWIILIFAAPISPLIFTWLHALCACLAEIFLIVYGLSVIIFPIYGLIQFGMNAEFPQSDLDRYKQMLFPFDRAILLLKPDLAREDIHDLLEAESETESETKSKTKLKKLQTILCQLGTEAVAENASWYLSFGERKLTLPQ